jgi:putative ATP-dependent endonuclease of OLD family
VRIESITIAGFRSFGPNPVCIRLADALTAIVGPNASGKTALLQAFAKMFGVTRAQRTLYRSDFHLPADVPPDDRTARELFIDVVVELPELPEGKASSETVARAFWHMRIEEPGAVPACRIRLEGLWEDDDTAEGEVTQELFWVDHLDSEVEDDDKHKVSPSDRGLIQFYYTPASRDAAVQIRASTGALAARLLKAIEWSKKTREAVVEATERMSDAFGGEYAIGAISTALGGRWKELHDEKTDTDPSLRLVSKRFEDVVAHIQVMFQKGPAAIERGLDVLSDGQQSLFYFALAAAVFDLEREAVAEKIKGFKADDLRIPALSIFGIEEPENHLSPYYLARIVEQVRSMLGGYAAQALITSHSPSVLSRVEPTEVRYCRCGSDGRATSVKRVQLPRKDQAAAKFIRGAFLAFPELYFARFVLLVEGDSERIVIPLLAKARGLRLDPSFVAIVPLGGRHVVHFWNLLRQLSIPHATLLDLDLGRSGGGFGRVKTAVIQLLKRGADRADLLELKDGKILPYKDLAGMDKWDSSDSECLSSWVKDLRRHGVYFSEPLDLDMAMLAAFPGAYEAIIPKGGGPAMRAEDAAKVVLGVGGKGLNDYKGRLASYKDIMPAYRYHFLTGSKPATHMQALSRLTDGELAEGMPNVYASLLKHIDANLDRE